MLRAVNPEFADSCTASASSVQTIYFVQGPQTVQVLPLVFFLSLHSGRVGILASGKPKLPSTKSRVDEDYKPTMSRESHLLLKRVNHEIPQTHDYAEK